MPLGGNIQPHMAQGRTFDEDVALSHPVESKHIQAVLVRERGNKEHNQ